MSGNKKDLYERVAKEQKENIMRDNQVCVGVGAGLERVAPPVPPMNVLLDSQESMLEKLREVSFVAIEVLRALQHIDGNINKEIDEPREFDKGTITGRLIYNNEELSDTLQRFKDVVDRFSDVIIANKGDA